MGKGFSILHISVFHMVLILDVCVWPKGGWLWRIIHRSTDLELLAARKEDRCLQFATAPKAEQISSAFPSKAEQISSLIF